MIESTEPSPSPSPEAPPEQPGGLAVQATRSGLWSLAGQVFQSALGSLSFIVLSRWIPPDAYGLLGMAMSVTGFLGVVGDSGMIAALIRRPAIDEVAETTAFWISFLGAAGMTAISVATAPGLRWFYREPRLLPVAAAIAFSFVLAAPARVAFAKLSKELRFRKLTAIYTTSTVLGLAVTFFAAWRGMGVWALVIQTLATTAIQTVLALVASPVRLRRAAFSRKVAGELTAFGSQMSGFSMAITVGRSLDSILAGRYLGTEVVGLLSMGLRLVLMPVQRVCGAASTVFLPIVVKLERERQGRAFAAVVRLIALSVFPFCLGLFAVAHEVPRILSPKWAEIGEVLGVFAIGASIEPIGSLSVSTLTAHGRSGALLRMSLWMIGVSWLGAIASVATGKVMWIAVAWAISNWVGALWLLALCWGDLGLGRWFAAELARPAVASVAMALGVRLIIHALGWGGSLRGLALGVPVGAAVYGALVWVLMPDDVRRALALLRGARSLEAREKLIT